MSKFLIESFLNGIRLDNFIGHYKLIFVKSLLLFNIHCLNYVNYLDDPWNMVVYNHDLMWIWIWIPHFPEWKPAS